MRMAAWLGGALVLMACGSEEPPALLGATDAGGGGMDVEAVVETGPPVREAAVPVCSVGTTQPCTCTDGSSGSQTCLSSQWGQCVCGTSGVSSGRCKAGYYVGELSGEYWSGAFDFLGTGQSWLPLPVTSVDQGGRAGFAITLEEDSTSLGVEFSVYAVRDGCMVGAAETPLFGTHPFFGAIRGELDCETGLFEGVLTGEYYVQGDPNDAYPFEGPLVGEFVPATETLERGTWDVVEHAMNDNPPGGAGTWSARWMGDSDSAPEPPPECAALLAAGG